jgi:hypothetical protein
MTMPQGPSVTRDAADATGYVANITATTGTAIKTTGARVVRVNVVAASASTGGIYDCTAIAGTAAGNKIFSIPATVGMYALEWPCSSGVTVFPGVGMTLAVSLS